MLENLTDEQLLEQFNDLLIKINEEFEGGTTFGVDLPTLRICEPELYNQYMEFRKEGQKRAKQKKTITD